MANYVLGTITTVAGWNGYESLIRILGYNGGTTLKSGYILRPAAGAVDVYVRSAEVKPAATDTDTLGDGLLAAGGQWDEEDFPAGLIYIYTPTPTRIVLNANGKI